MARVPWGMMVYICARATASHPLMCNLKRRFQYFDVYISVKVELIAACEHLCPWQFLSTQAHDPQQIQKHIKKGFEGSFLRLIGFGCVLCVCVCVGVG